MLTPRIEAFEAERPEVILLEVTTTIIVLRGNLRLTREFRHFGHVWSVPVEGQFLLLPPGTYYAHGSAALWILSREPLSNSPAQR